MIAQAQRLYDADAAKSGSKQEEGEAGVRFLLADCAVPEEYPGGPFDVVFGAWLLNYAKDKAGLVNMFRNGALNLKSGGVFVSVTYPASEDPTASLNEERRARPPPEGSGGLVFSKIGDVEGGIFMGAHGETEVGDVDFRCWWLRGGVYEGAAREAGLEGELRWGRTRVPERWLRGEERWEGGASRTELETYVDVPRFGVLVVGR